MSDNVLAKKSRRYHPHSDVAARILEQAGRSGRDGMVPYAGELGPHEAWQLVVEGAAVLVDVRTEEEWKFVGHVPGSTLVPWMTDLSMTRNPHFLRELEQQVGKDELVLLLCRSAKRSASAAEAATRYGFQHVFNVLEGFEGDLNEFQQRGVLNGWRFAGLPWVQD